MQEQAISGRVLATADQVWGVLSDFGAISAWAPNVDHSCLLRDVDDPASVGTVRRIQAGRITVLETIVESEPASVLAYEIEGLPGPARTVQNRWTLTERDGGTDVVLTSSVEVGPRPPQQAAARVMTRVLGRTSRVMIDGLTAHVEAATRAPGASDG